MALNLTNVFQSLGRIGRNLYLINTAQNSQGTPYSELAGYSYINPTWIANLTQTYDQLIRSETGGMGTWQQAAQTILMSMVAQQDPQLGQTLGASLNYLYNQMIAQSATVQACTIGSSVTANSGNTGQGSVFVTTQRGDGLILQNTIAETGNIFITSDSYTGGATVGQEPWQYTGQPNISSLGTGTSVTTYDWDWPQGSGVTAGGNCVAANQYTQSNANILTNGDFATWTSGVPNNWNFVTGSGTQVTGMTSGTSAIQFTAGATLYKMTTQFGNGATTTGATAGTSITLPPYIGFAVNFYLKASGVITGGVLTVSLVDGTGTVINDQSGNANTSTITLSTVSSSTWGGHPIAFRLPINPPSTIRLQLNVSTAIAGANLLVAWCAFAQQGGGITNCYPGGMNVAIFSRPDFVYVAVPEPDGYTLAMTNNRGGATLNATFQTLFNRLFQTPTLLLPYSNSPSISDGLIVNP